MDNQLKPRKFISRPLLARFLGLLALLLVFSAGLVAGLNLQANREGLNLSQFWQVYHLIQQNYVGQLDKEKASEGATRGLVESLGDPFSSYLSSSEKQSLNDELKGEFQGIGAELTEKNQLITVVAPLSGSPAEAAGLKANDVIIKVDDQATENSSLADVVKKIRGPKGTSVKLTVARSTEEQPLELTITRDSIQVKSANQKMIGNVGYLEITQFGDTTVAETEVAVKELAAKNPKAIIIDLRNNPGGYLNDVPPMAGFFLPPSVVVKEKYRNGKTDELRSTSIPILGQTPLYVLVNGGSASAAEILAGALQDYKRATLVGQKTFGKGSVQDLIDLPGKSALRISIAEWLTPNGRVINKLGIEPDVKVNGDKTATADPVLDKALELAAK